MKKRTKVILLFHLVEIRQRKMKSICGIKNILNLKKTYACKNIKKEDTVMVEYTYTNEMGIKKKQEVTTQLKKNWQGYYLAWK